MSEHNGIKSERNLKLLLTNLVIWKNRNIVLWDSLLSYCNSHVATKNLYSIKIVYFISVIFINRTKIFSPTGFSNAAAHNFFLTNQCPRGIAYKHLEVFWALLSLVDRKLWICLLIQHVAGVRRVKSSQGSSGPGKSKRSLFASFYHDGSGKTSGNDLSNTIYFYLTFVPLIQLDP